MEDFKSKYLTRCGELGINPITELVNLFNKSDRKDTAILSLETLNLSAVSMNLKTISALSAGLFENSFFTKLILADTFLGDDGTRWCQHLVISNLYRLHQVGYIPQNKLFCDTLGFERK